MDKRKSVKVNKRYFKIAKDFADIVENNGYRISELHIFGSRLTGINTKWSDLDLCLVTTDLKRDRLAEAVKFTLLGRKVSDLIEPHLMSPADFDNRYNLLAKEVKKTGVRVI